MKLFPKRKPYRKGYFSVGEGHELYYALFGNPKGVPVLYVHGGPGAGCGEKAHKHFDPKKFNILTIDQRGAGKSKPFASTRANTTQKLVQDFRKFLRFLKIKKTFLFGGSWGSCLSLCYAIKYPKTVLGMVLRGIYLGTRPENDYFLKGGAKTHFPEVWEHFANVVPKMYRKNPAKYYWRMMNSKNQKTVFKFCHEWALYECSMLHLEYSAKEAAEDASGKQVIPLAKLEAKYLLSDAFLPKNHILRNVHKLKNIPISIVHGRYDFVCTPDMAYKLYRALPKSKLFLVTAGHSASDPEIQTRIIREIHDMARKFFK